jgi:hypothetical protein
MATNRVSLTSGLLTPINGSGFRIKRPIITSNGIVSDVDPTVKKLLDEASQLLGKKIFAADESVDDLTLLLKSPLSPKHIPANNWARGSLLQVFGDTAEAADTVSLSDLIDKTPDLSALKYAFVGNLSNDWTILDFNTQTILGGNAAITDYLIAYAFYVMDITEIFGLRNFLYNNRAGVKSVVNYLVDSASRVIIDSEQMNVQDADTDGSALFTQLESAGLTLSSASFKAAAQAVINNYVFNTAQSTIIDATATALGITLPPGMKPTLIKLIQQSPVVITAANAEFFLPMFISQASGPVQLDATTTDTTQSDQDFNVQTVDDDASSIQINKTAVTCSSQLYYSMVTGDELNVFGAAEYFTRKYLIRNGIEIQDSRLRDDLQSYVFSRRFTDLRTGRVLDRTRRPERQMFYRQVFNSGKAEVPEELVLNVEFPNLWKVLMLEAARYIEKAQASPNPDSYVSRQNVMQAVEDLQYNLSTHCTGMAIVVTPLIYAELDFVIRRIFKHPEILAQVVPAGGTWWKVVEVLYMAMNNVRPKATVLYNKAKLGNSIIRAIADYNPATFEDDKSFSSFISDVDAYISTQSILQEALTGDLKADQEDGPMPKGMIPQLTPPPMPSIPAMPGAKTGTDEWDF